MVKNKEKIIIYLGGGAMSGVYGAGVLKGIYNLSLINSIEAIYAGSVGSFNAAYLLSGQVELGPTIYWEDLQNNFIFRTNLVWGTLDLLKNKFVKSVTKNEFHNVVDINYACRVIASIKPLDLKNIDKNPIKFFVKVLNTNTGKIEYINFHDFPKIELLKAAVSVKPYFFDETEINGKYYIDGTIKEPIGYDYLVKKHPNQKIIIILNEPIKRGLRHYFKNFLEGSASSLYPYPISLFKIFLENEREKRIDIKKTLANPNILLLYPNFKRRTRPRTVNPDTLKQTFYHGMRDAENVLSFIEVK